MNRYQQATALGTKRYNRDRMLAMSSEMICLFRLKEEDKSKMRGACCHLADALDRCSGSTLQHRWSDFETKIWPKWAAGHDGFVLFGPGAREFWSLCAWSFHRLSGCQMCASTSGSFACRKIILFDSSTACS